MTTNTFAYNGFGARVSKSDSSGSNSYLRASSGLIGSIVSDSGATYTQGVSEKRGTTSTFYHADIKNSVAQTSTSSQSVVASKQYDAFGNEVSSSGPWQGRFQYGGAFGYHTDSDYGLKHLGARYYDSTTGRFLSRDPIKDGRNWYGYCYANPLNLFDATGLEPAPAEFAPEALLPDGRRTEGGRFGGEGGAAPRGVEGWSLYRWLYTGNPYASDEVYEAALDQAWKTLLTWFKHFAVANGVAAPPTAAAVGPVPKGLVKLTGLARVVETPGSSPFTSGIRVAAVRTGSPQLHSAARFVKANHALIWLYFEVGAAWYATYKTLNDPDVWVTES